MEWAKRLMQITLSVYDTYRQSIPSGWCRFWMVMNGSWCTREVLEHHLSMTALENPLWRWRRHIHQDSRACSIAGVDARVEPQWHRQCHHFTAEDIPLSYIDNDIWQWGKMGRSSGIKQKH